MAAVVIQPWAGHSLTQEWFTPGHQGIIPVPGTTNFVGEWYHTVLPGASEPLRRITGVHHEAISVDNDPFIDKLNALVYKGAFTLQKL